MRNYKQTATEVLRLVGGEKNVVQLEHCSTRLRFSLADTSVVDVDGLKKTPGVMGVVNSGLQCQVVIGNDVIEVYEEIMKISSFSNQGGKKVPSQNQGKPKIGAIIFDYIVGIFQPLVPAIAGAGVLKALLTVLITLGIMNSDMVLYRVLVGVANATLYYLPVLVAYTTATKFNSNRLVAAALAAAMIHPDITALLSGDHIHLFGLKLQNINYSGQVFPAIMIVIFMSFLERWCNKWCPKSIRVFFVPLVCFAISFPVGLLILGPLGYNVGTILTSVILGLYNTLGWLAVAVLAAILPFMISLGMHKALVPYAVSSISSPGFDMLYLPASLAHNISESGACFAVALKTKDENLRSTAISAGISGLFGITEPALYGVTLQHKKVITSVVISSFCGGLFIGLMKIKALVAVGPGLASMAMFVDPKNNWNFIWALGGFAVSMIVAFILTFILYKDEQIIESRKEVTGTENFLDTDFKNDITAKDAFVIGNSLNGNVIPLTDVKNAVFSNGILGPGIAIEPNCGEVYAPADGVAEFLQDTNHALSIVTTTGAELLIHIGLDTVRLEGKGFYPQIKNKDNVKKGQLIMKFDLEQMKEAGYDMTTSIVVTNAESFDLEILAQGMTAQNENLMKLKAKEEELA